MTGSSNIAAKTGVLILQVVPGSAADMPAPAMIARKNARPVRPLAPRAVASGSCHWMVRERVGLDIAGV